MVQFDKPSKINRFTLLLFFNNQGPQCPMGLQFIQHNTYEEDEKGGGGG